MKEETESRSLIIKFLGGEITGGELDALKEWLNKNPDNRRTFDVGNEIWQESALKAKNEYYNPEKGWSDISQKLGIGKSRTNQVYILNKNIFRILVAAASLTLMVAIGALYLWRNEKGSQKHLTEEVTIFQTNEGEKANLILPDSTMITINSGSTLEYSNYYNDSERKVKLSGEAYFEVNTDPEKPFQVQLEKMTITATGTRFNVLSYNNEDRIETTLEEGNIKVSISGMDAIDVRPGQQIVYFTRTNKVVLKEVTAESYSSWKENKLQLRDTPLEEALRLIARRYNVIFEVRNSDILELRYTATFIDESIEDVMQMLGTVSPIRYKIINRTTISDMKYLKPKIIVEKKKRAL